MAKDYGRLPHEFAGPGLAPLVAEIVDREAFSEGKRAEAEARREAAARRGRR